MTEEFGRRIWVLSLSLRGTKTEPQWRTFLWDAAKLMNMNATGLPQTWRYPVNDKGGNGLTMVQPITESFLTIDTWPDHDGVYFAINSCKKFDERQVVHWLEVDQELVVIDSMSGSLSLPGNA
jgi:S-adenosylmethionine/arginine decarboxylase-like enzyme